MKDPGLKLAFYLLAIVVVTLPLWMFNHYVFCDNETNHTGGTPYILFVIFIPVVFFSLWMLRIDGKKWILPLLLATGGSLNVIVLDALHIMESYSSWIHSGMPERANWSLFETCRR